MEYIKMFKPEKVARLVSVSAILGPLKNLIALLMIPEPCAVCGFWRCSSSIHQTIDGA